MGHHTNRKHAAKAAELPVPKKSWPKWIVTGGGVGFLRPAPGSWGTAVPAGIYWLALMGGGYLPENVPMVGMGMLVLAVISGALLVQYGYWACCYFRKIDPGAVVLDEYAGFAITVAFVPVPLWFCHNAWTLWLFVAGLFVIFRATDTLKIPPARQLENLPYGWGILLDDVAAGVQANIIAQVLVRVVQWPA